MRSPSVIGRIRLVGLLLFSGLGLASCAFFFPSAPAEDAGHASFVRQAVPILQGRKVSGYDEVKLLTDLIGVLDREKVVRALMTRTEFVDHWAEVLVDDLRIDREGFQAQQACYGPPLRAVSDGGALAGAVINTIPQQVAAGGAFNMSDVLRSTLERDHLYPVYRAHLYPHTNVTPVATDELQRRDIIGAKFGEIYLNRQMGCLICHNSEFSKSGPDSGWTRTYPIQGLFEKALFGSSSGEPTKNAYAMFRSDVQGGPLSPWGMQNCGSYNTSLPNDPQNVNAHFIQPQGKTFGIHDLQGILQFGFLDLKLNGLQRTLPAQVQQTCDFCQANCQGASVDIAQAANNAPNAAQVKAILLNANAPNTCQSCHGGAATLYITNGPDWANDLITVPSSQKNGETLVIPGNANGSYLIKKLTNAAGIVGSQMPLGGSALSNADLNLIKAWINGLPAPTACAPCATTDCGQLPQEVKGHSAFAYLVAARIVNNVWDEVFGTPVTIANYFPRNFAERQVLWNLTEFKFLPTEWSLRDLLARILTSEFFNRVPPRSTAATSPYTLPRVFDPWTEADPRIPPVNQPGYDPNANPQNHLNAMSEAVHRYSARSLTHSVHKALGWQKPERFPGNAYPSSDLMRSIGFYFSEEQPGFQTVDFQGLLAWETVHGQCGKPSGVGTDWIDRLVTAINTFNPASPGGPLTVGDVATIVRDWLLGHGAITTTAPVGLNTSERDAIVSLFGVASLSDPVTPVPGLEAKLRQMCGIQLEAPQFQLAGIAEKNLGSKPRLRVCNTPECSYQQMCEALRPGIEAQLASNESLLCGVNSVNVLTLLIPDKIWIDLCPPGICGVITKFIPEGCPLGDLPVGGAPRTIVQTNVSACPVSPPACDPRCSRIDCCGGPLDPRRLGTRDTLVAWADGGRVVAADGIQIRPKDGQRYEPLSPTRQLAAGDLLVIPPGSRLEISTKEGRVLRTPRQGLPKDAKTPVVTMMISGETALMTRRPGIAPPASLVPGDKIKRILETPGSHHGEAGVPLTDARRGTYQYSAEELHVEDLRARGLLPEQLQQRPR